MATSDIKITVALEAAVIKSVRELALEIHRSTGVCIETINIDWGHIQALGKAPEAWIEKVQMITTVKE